MPDETKPKAAKKKAKGETNPIRRLLLKVNKKYLAPVILIALGVSIVGTLLRDILASFGIDVPGWIRTLPKFIGFSIFLFVLVLLLLMAIFDAVKKRIVPEEEPDTSDDLTEQEFAIADQYAELMLEQDRKQKNKRPFK
jgi:uncharacterized membrane protein